MTWSLSPPSPFGEPWPRVQLEAAPLVRVVAQARFTQILQVSNESFVAPFQEAIRDRYPELGRELQQQVVVTEQGAQMGSPATIWRFRDPDTTWQISLAPDFVALDTDRYTDRHDFFERLDSLMQVAAETVKPSLVTRLGVRYVDRVPGTELMHRLPDFVRAEILGLETVDLGEGELVRELTEAQFVIDETHLKARWGYLPPHTSHEPSIPASESPSWLLDLDAFVRDLGRFNVEALAQMTRELSDVVYRFFRWVVSDEFLREHGGDL